MKNFSDDGYIIPENLIKIAPDKKLLKKIENLKGTVLLQTESNFHDICICENKTGRFLKYGNSIQAGIIDIPEYKGNIPYLNYFLQTYFLKPDAKRILVIGFGIGHLVNQFEKLFENLERIDAVDIEENIIDIATKYFDFKQSEKFHFYLQDALVFLRDNKTKYDIIITDIAGNEGTDIRFFEDEFLQNIKKSLKKNGILAFNSCANIDFDENDDTFFGFTINQYKKHFKNFAVFNGLTSDLTTFKALYDIDKRVFDITNAIIIASDMKLSEKYFKNISNDKISKIKNIGIDITPYSKDLHKVYCSNYQN